MRRESRFASSVRLNRHSAGVIPAQQVETVFSLYNPPDIPDAAQPSWGDAPLAPLAYAWPYCKFDNQLRWRGLEREGA